MAAQTGLSVVRKSGHRSVAVSPGIFSTASMKRRHGSTTMACRALEISRRASWATSTVSEAALAEVACRGASRMFKVALTDALTFTSKSLGLSDKSTAGGWGTAIPPNVDCCGAGPSMNSEMQGILEYWFRDYEVSSRMAARSDIRGAGRGAAARSTGSRIGIGCRRLTQINSRFWSCAPVNGAVTTSRAGVRRRWQMTDAS